MLVLLAACSTPARRANGDASDPVIAVLRAQETAWNRGDVDAFMSIGYWQSPDLHFLSGGSWTQGYQPVLEHYRERYQAGGKDMGTLTFTDLDARTLCDDAAFVRGKWRLEFEHEEPMWGLFTLVMRRFPEGWRIVSDHTSLGTE